MRDQESFLLEKYFIYSGEASCTCKDMLNNYEEFNHMIFGWWSLIIILLAWINCQKFSGKHSPPSTARDPSLTFDSIKLSIKILRLVSRKVHQRKKLNLKSIGIVSIDHKGKMWKGQDTKLSLMITLMTLSFMVQKERKIKVKVTMYWFKKDIKLQK